MAADFRAALSVIERMKREGVVAEYAVGGATALVFWTEPVATFDLDVFVILPAAHTPLVSLEPLYRWAKTNAYAADGEHLLIEGIPVQFIPAHNALADEAIAEAATLDYQGVAVRVIRPEYLIALYLEPSARTQERVATLREESPIDESRLASILHQYNLQLPS